MFHSTSRLMAVALLIGPLAALGGCGGKPMPFPIPESEMGDRPGIGPLCGVARSVRSSITSSM